MKRSLSFLIVLVAMFILSGCELINQFTYRDIGDNNYIMKVKIKYHFKYTEIEEPEHEIVCYINRKDSWYGFHAVKENYYMFYYENENNNVTSLDYRGSDHVQERIIRGDLNGEAVRNNISVENDLVNITKVIDQLNKMVNNDQLELKSFESDDPSLMVLKLYETTLLLTDFDEQFNEILYSDDLMVSDLAEQKIIIGLQGNQIKYISYSQGDLVDGDIKPFLKESLYFTMRFYIEEVGKATDARLNEFKNLEFSPIKKQ